MSLMVIIIITIIFNTIWKTVAAIKMIIVYCQFQQEKKSAGLCYNIAPTTNATTTETTFKVRKYREEKG